MPHISLSSSSGERIEITAHLASVNSRSFINENDNRKLEFENILIIIGSKKSRVGRFL
jgi:hypothetical protein